MKIFLYRHNGRNLFIFLLLVFCIKEAFGKTHTEPLKLRPLFPKINYTDNYPHLPAQYKPIKKEYCFIVYMAGDNDLRNFLYRNIDEMQSLLKQLPTQTSFHLFIHTDTHNPGQSKKTIHLINYNNTLMQIGETMSMDSGKEDSLVFTVEQAMHYCPADKIILGLWNHGTGDLNPLTGRIINSSKMYSYNLTEGLLTLDRSRSIIDLMELVHYEREHRGICFDETTGNYLSNQKVGSALKRICNGCLQGRKIDLFFCDACLMSSVGFAYEIKPWVNFLVSSQEVVLATGFRYDQILNFVAQNNVAMKDFAIHMVDTFKKAYNPITNDYTLSAIDLTQINPLYDALNRLADNLIYALKNQKNNSARDFIKRSSSRTTCTAFNEPTYKDLGHLIKNMQQNIVQLELNNPTETVPCRMRIVTECANILELIRKTIFANATGKNLSQAMGISIYLPERRLHPSFQETNFAKNSTWLPLITQYLAS